MAEQKQCATIGSSRIKRVYAVLEDVPLVLQRPTLDSYILPAGDPSMSQTPTYSDSEEMSGTTDVVNQFRNALEAGEASIPMYVSMDSKDGRLQGHDLFVAAMGNVQARNKVTAKAAAQDVTVPAGINASATTIPYQGASAVLPDSGTFTIGVEKITYAAKTGTEFTGCARGQGGTLAAFHDNSATITLTVTANVNKVDGLAEGDTEIPFDGASDPFPESGVVTIGNEQIAYTGKTETQLTGCTRGHNSTTAETHADDAIITLTVTASVNKPESVLAGSIPAEETTIPLAEVSGGFFPRRGVVTVAGTDEKVRYTGVQTDENDVVTALTGCQRGFDATTAAEIADDAVLTLNSQVFYWDNCRQTLSLWLEVDHSVFFARGAKVTQVTFPMSKSGGQHADFSLNFSEMGWVGRSFLKAAPVGNVITVETEAGDAAWGGYCVGGIIRNTTRDDDNSGSGYTITAIDEERGTLTITPTPNGWQENDRLDPWLPKSKLRDEPILATNARVFINGKAGKLMEGSLTYGTPVSFASEIGDDYPGESADNTRQLTIDNSLYFRAADIVEFKRGFDGYDAPVDVVLGGKPGYTLSHSLPRVRFQAPTVGSQDPFVTLSRTGTILGKKGNDSAYIIQE